MSASTPRDGFLGPARTEGYTPRVIGALNYWAYNSQRPFFRLSAVEILKEDPQVQFGLLAIYGPLNRLKVNVDAPPKLKRFIDEQFKRVVARSMAQIRKYIEYGHMAGEPQYKLEGGRLVYDSLKDFHPLDVYPMEYCGKLVGVQVRNVPSGQIELGAPRYLWVVNQPNPGSFWGRSRLSGAWEPWMEKAGRNAGKDLRRLYFFKNSSRGDVLYYPDGVTNVGTDEVPVYKSNQDIAREIVEKLTAGGVLAMPNTIKEGTSTKEWELEKPSSSTTPGGLIEYIKELDLEILKGLGVPPEVLQTTGDSGSGYAGRSIPKGVFNDSLDEMASTIVAAVDRCIIRWLVRANFGRRAHYEVHAESLTPEPPQPGAGGAPGGVPAGGPGGAPAADGRPVTGGGGAQKPTKTGPNVAWEPYQGPHGGHGVKNRQTGRIRYGMSRADRIEARAAKKYPDLRSRVRSAKDKTDTRALAEWYAGFWNDFLNAGLDVPGTEIEKAGGELADGNWIVAFDQRGNRWVVLPAGPDDDRVQLATEHAPVGGIQLPSPDGVVQFYRGGQFIPKEVIDALSPQDLARVHGMKDASRQRLASRGDITATTVKDRLTGYASGPLDRFERSRAARTFSALNRYHGELTHHRLDEQADIIEDALTKVPADETGIRMHLERRLAILHHMAHMSETGGFKKTPKNKAAKGMKGMPRAPKAGQVYSVPTKGLKVDPERFQFKLNVNKQGVGEELKSVQKFNPDFAGVISVWQDPADGETYVVNGHHRVELANRTDHPTMAVRYLDAPDAQHARAAGALINIAEGKGTAVDAAKFMRDTGATPEDFSKHGVSLAGPVAKDAVILRDLSDSAFKSLASGELDVDRAKSIGQHVKDHGRQDELLGWIAKKEESTGREYSPRVVAEMAREMAAVPTTEKTEATLWGDETTTASVFGERAELKSFLRSELTKEHKDFQAVASERRAGNVERAGNILNVDANKEAAQQAAETKNTFDALANYKGTLSDAINHFAERYANARTNKDRDAIRKDALRSVRETLSQTDAGDVRGAVPAGEGSHGEAADGGIDGKEPHELTVDQYLPTHSTGGVKPSTVAQLRKNLDNSKRFTPHNAHIDQRHLENIEAAGRQVHKTKVQLALAAGKTVPPEVLAAYPDLAEKYGKGKPPAADPLAGMTKDQAKAIMQKIAAPDRLPENHDDYFLTNAATKVVPLDKIKNLRARPEGIENAGRFMEGARQGLLPKRGPVKVVANDDGTFTVADGNSTFANAKKSGWSTLPVEVVSQEWMEAEKTKTLRKENTKTVGKLASDKTFTDEERALPKSLSMPHATEEAVFSAAKQAKPVFDKILDAGEGIEKALGATVTSGDDAEFLAALQKPGPVVRVGGIKSQKRSAEKVEADYNGNWAKLHDTIRATVAVDTAAEVPGAIEAARKELESKGWKIAKSPKNRFATPTLEGYRDMLLSVQSPDGLVGELQVHLKPMLIGKEEAHKLYEQERTLFADIKKAGGTATPEQMAEVEKLINDQRSIYSGAWLKSLGLHDPEDAKQLELQRGFDEEQHGGRWAGDLAEAMTPAKGEEQANAKSVSGSGPVSDLPGSGRDAGTDRGPEPAAGTADAARMGNRQRPGQVPAQRDGSLGDGVSADGSGGGVAGVGAASPEEKYEPTPEVKALVERRFGKDHWQNAEKWAESFPKEESGSPSAGQVASIQRAAAKALADHFERNRADMPIEEAYAAVKKEIPSLTPKQFREAMQAVRNDTRDGYAAPFRFSSWTGSHDRMTPELQQLAIDNFGRPYHDQGALKTIGRDGEERQVFAYLVHGEKPGKAKPAAIEPEQPQAAPPAATTAPQPAPPASKVEFAPDAGQKIAEELQGARAFGSGDGLFKTSDARDLVEQAIGREMQDEEFVGLMAHLWDQRTIEMHILNEVKELTPEWAKSSLRRNDKVYAYGYVKDYDKMKEAIKKWIANPTTHPTAGPKEKKGKAKAKEAAATGTPPAPGATSAGGAEPGYDAFAKEYRDNFKRMNQYTVEQIGSKEYADRMAKMADEHPEWVERIEAEEEAKQLQTRTQQPAAQTPQKTTPHLTLANDLAAKLKAGGQLTAKDVWAAADTAYGGMRAEGRYGPSDAYDALETAFSKSLAGKTNPTGELDAAIAESNAIAERVNQLPTQTNRSGNKDAFQQFSTPPHYAYAAAWAANLAPGEVVLEPSAGTGSLAIHAQNAGAEVYANELDPRRAEYLKDLFGNDRVHVENAEQIAGILPKRGVPAPTTVLMNPPFSQSAGRLGDKKDLQTGAKHIEEALQMLAPGGRLVAIVGRGMTPDSPTYRDWFKRVGENHTLRANVGVGGNEYAKYGTKFGTRVLVIDKAKVEGDAVTGDAESIPDLMTKLAGVRNDRSRGPQTTGPASGKSSGTGGAQEAQGVGGRDGDAAPAILSGVSGEPAGVGVPVAGVSGRPSDARLRPADSAAGLGGGTDGGQSGGVAAGSGSESGAGGGLARPGGTPGQPGRGNESGEDGSRRRGRAGTKPVQQPANRLPELRPPVKLTLASVAHETKAPVDRPMGAPDDPKAEPKSQADLGESLYASYRPALVRVAGAKPHPSPLVESAAMASVKPPQPTYTPTLSPDVVEKGLLSEAALESVVYAGQSHERFLPAGEGETATRRGYFIGDGTGAGKGRQIAGVIADNWNQGRKKHVWVSQKQTLFEDAKRDWRDLGMNEGHLVHFDTLRKGAKPPDDGVAFVTYDTLKSTPKDPTKTSNLDHLVDWLGKDFDGVIAFDEAHGMANAIDSEGGRGAKKASKKAMSGVELQRRLPNARVLYVSATGATEVSNLAYADRLGIWGRGTPFATKQDFINEMQQGGVAAMEAVAQSLKATGGYAARSLAVDGVTYSRLTHKMSDEQRVMYDAAADGWQAVLQNIDKALESSGGKESAQAKSAALSQFWGAQQRFFNQMMTSIQTPSVIQGIEKDIAEGRSPVVQLVNTMEAATKRALERKAGDEDEDSLEHLDVSPREVLMQYLEKSFPIHRHEQYVDEAGNTQTRIAKDSHGEPIEDPQAVAIRDRMLDMVGTLRIPESPLDMIINHFGHDAVSECTGRTQRVIWQEQPDGTKKKVVERRNSSAANSTEAAAFQDGRKKVLVFSDAGGTGRSYHADKNAKNQQQRVHYMLQPGWRADNAVQGLGRTHRTNQAIAPTYRLVEVDELKAQKRFVSTIARRLDQLGALTRGQRQAGSSGLFSAADNLESPEAKLALGRFFMDMEAGRIEGLHYDEVMTQLGLKKPKDDEKSRRKQEEPPAMGQFLNRLLSLRVDMQAKVFDAFDSRLQQTVEQAVREGTLDTGVENFPAERMVREKDEPVYRDAETGAEARLVTTKAVRKTEKRPWERNLKGEKPLGYAQNNQSGRIYAIYKGIDRTDATTGQVTPQYLLQGPTSKQWRGVHEITKQNFTTLDEAQAEPIWNEEFKAAPDFSESTEHFLTGAFLPIWDRIPGKDRPKVYRLQTDDGQNIVGRHIPTKAVPILRKNLGIAGDGPTYKPADVHAELSRGAAQTVILANGWKLKPVRVQNERRIELIGPSLVHWNELTADGVMRERINYDTRMFIPTGADGAAVLERLTKSRPITDVDKPSVQLSRAGSAPVADLLQAEIARLRSTTRTPADERRLAAYQNQYATATAAGL